MGGVGGDCDVGLEAHVDVLRHRFRRLGRRSTLQLTRDPLDWPLDRLLDLDTDLRQCGQLLFGLTADTFKERATAAPVSVPALDPVAARAVACIGRPTTRAAAAVGATTATAATSGHELCVLLLLLVDLIGHVLRPGRTGWRQRHRLRRWAHRRESARRRPQRQTSALLHQAKCAGPAVHCTGLYRPAVPAPVPVPVLE